MTTCSDKEDTSFNLRILGIDYTVSESPIAGVCGNDGVCSFTNNEIIISENISFQMKRTAVLHEVLEALNGHLQIKLEHDQLSALEAGLNQVMCDNPHVLNLWTPEEEE